MCTNWQTRPWQATLGVTVLATLLLAWALTAAPLGQADVREQSGGLLDPPTVDATASPTTGRAPLVVAFQATGADADGDPLTYSWDFDGNGTTDSTAEDPSHTYTTAGTFTARVTVRDPGGLTGTDEVQITVQPNRNPQIQNTTAARPQAGFAPLQVQFTGAATDPDGQTVSYEWDLDGDGTFETAQQSPVHTYAQPGTYSPRLRVSDGVGGSSTRTLTVNVLSEAEQPGARFRVLVFSKTAAFRHGSIPSGIAAIQQLGRDHGFQVDAIEESALFTDENLARYDGVIFLSTTGDVLNDEQQAAFERYYRSGKGYVGIHAAADTEYGWPWYGRLVGGYFRNHPPGTPAGSIDVEDGTDHSTKALPARWDRVDEWYNYQSPINPSVGGGGTDYSPRAGGVHVLATLDESTYVEQDGSDGVNDDHPISWCQRYDGGRSWYTGMGHTNSTFTEPLFLSHLLGGIEVAVGAANSEACGNRAPLVTRASATPPAGIAPLGVRFSADGSDADGDELAFSWEFGDGATASGSSPQHTYTQPGTYTAKVTVTDAFGSTATDEVEVVVRTAPPAGQGGPPAEPPALGLIRGLRANGRCFRDASTRPPKNGRRAMAFTYRLTAAAMLQVTVSRRNGSPAWTYCPPRAGKRPGTYREVGSGRIEGKAGEHTETLGSAGRTAARKTRFTFRAGRTRGSVSLARVLEGKRLRPGTYWLEVSSLDGAGKPSATRRVKFWVLTSRRG